MSEGITVRAELPSGMAHAAALNMSRTQIPLLTVFITTSKELCAVRCRLSSYCMSVSGGKGQSKGQVVLQQGAWSRPLSLSANRLFCGSRSQIPCLYPAGTPD